MKRAVPDGGTARFANALGVSVLQRVVEWVRKKALRGCRVWCRGSPAGLLVACRPEQGGAAGGLGGFRADWGMGGLVAGLGLFVVYEVHEFLAGLGLVERAGEVAGGGYGVLLLHAAHLHTHMARLDHDHHAERVERLLDALLYL